MSLAAYFLLLDRSLCSHWLWETNVEKILGKQCLYLFWGTSSVDNEIIVFQFSLLPSHKDMFPNPRGNIIFINHLSRFTFNSYSSILEDFPGHPLVKTSCFQCRGLGFSPWLGKFLIAPSVAKKKRKRKVKETLREYRL